MTLTAHSCGLHITSKSLGSASWGLFWVLIGRVRFRLSNLHASFEGQGCPLYHMPTSGQMGRGGGG